LKHELSFRGYSVLTEKDPDMTFSRLNDFIPDLLIVDLILDDNNGGAISHQVKGIPGLQTLPIIILSDYELETHYPSRFSCDQVIQKSESLDLLLNAIQNLHDETRYALH
jgi:DNA-binding response OmpR family regulator